LLGENKAFLKLKYLLCELSERLFFQLYIVVRNLKKSKIDSFLENIITSGTRQLTRHFRSALFCNKKQL
jgi:hypothetical protein